MIQIWSIKNVSMVYVKFYINLGEFWFQFKHVPWIYCVCDQQNYSLYLIFFRVIVNVYFRRGEWLHLADKRVNCSLFLTVKLSSAWKLLSTYMQTLSKSFISSLDSIFLGREMNRTLRRSNLFCRSLTLFAPTKRSFQHGSCWPYSPFLQPPGSARRWTVACGSGQSVDRD